MFRAEIRRMHEGNPDHLPQGELWKVVIYEDERFVRSDRDNITYAMARRLAEELNYYFGQKRKAKGAS